VLMPGRDALLLGFYAAAKGRAAKGRRVWPWHSTSPSRPRRPSTPAMSRAGPGTASSGEASLVREFDYTDEEYAYHLGLRQCDPKFIETSLYRSDEKPETLVRPHDKRLREVKRNADDHGMDWLQARPHEEQMAQPEALRTPPAIPPRTATMLANATTLTNQFASSTGPSGLPKAA
jgi:hypothetical protein